MEPVLILFTLIGVPLLILCIPVAIVAATVLAHRVATRWFALEEQKLALARWEAERRYDLLRLHHSLPPWLDAGNPLDVAAWRAATMETSRLTAHG